MQVFRVRRFLVRATEMVGILTVDLEFEKVPLSTGDNNNSNKMKLLESERANKQIEDKKKILEFMVSKNS